MRICVSLFLAFLSFNCIGQANLKKAIPYANILSPEELKKQLTIIAGPEMEGRETATEGQRKAAAYIETRMKEIGLLPAAGDKYQISYPVYRDSVIDAGITVDSVSFKWNKDFTAPPTNFNSRMGFSEVDFIDLEDSLWKAGKIDVSGKPVIFRLTKTDDKAKKITALINGLMRKGAAAALIIDSITAKDTIDLPGDMSIRPALSRQLINHYVISPQVAEKIFENGFDSSKLPYRIYKADVQLDYTDTAIQIESSNVIGYIEGSSKKDEFVVISAHYDHMGKKDSLIWYGADDDGTGTATILTLAKAFAQAKAEGHGPARSIVFIAFSGEEKGLWGSKVYTANPLFPFDKTTANLNIDMIGRIDSPHIKNSKLNYVYLVGDHKLSSELPVIAKAANVYTQLELNAKYNDSKDSEKIYTRSDHYNFAKNGVPVIFFYDGGHPDYHRVTDTVDKIDFELMSKRAKLVFYTAWEMANRKTMLLRDKSLKD
jgi:hypothetical protein